MLQLHPSKTALCAVGVDVILDVMVSLRCVSTSQEDVTRRTAANLHANVLGNFRLRRTFPGLKVVLVEPHSLRPPYGFRVDHLACYGTER